MDGDLDAELRQLFTSDRLDVPVRADADQVIVAGARRIRRRRIATATAGGVFAVVVAIIGGIALTSGNPDAMPPATTKRPPPPAATSVEITSTLPMASSAAAPPLSGGTSSPMTKTQKPPTTSRPTDPGPPVLNYPVLGPTGVGGLELGQTLEEAQATGQLGEVVQDGGPDGCSTYKLTSRTSGEVYLAETVQAIVAHPVQTPEGVGPGWSIPQVKAVYPEVDEDFVEANGGILVSVPGNQSAHYRLEFADGLVTSVSLQAADRNCF